MSIWTAVFLIIICALLWDVGIVFQKQAVDRFPRKGSDMKSSASLFTPVSVARGIQGSGFVILAVARVNGLASSW
jgi:hypothetical protein